MKDGVRITFCALQVFLSQVCTAMAMSVHGRMKYYHLTEMLSECSVCGISGKGLQKSYFGKQWDGELCG